MIWADRVAIAWAVILFLGLTFLGGGKAMPVSIMWPIFEWLVMVPWLALRAIDFAFTGRIRRVIG